MLGMFLQNSAITDAERTVAPVELASRRTPPHNSPTEVEPLHSLGAHFLPTTLKRVVAEISKS